MPPLSQTESWLIEAANQSIPFDAQQMTAIKQAIMAPNNLHALFLVLRNLHHILPIAKQICLLCDHHHFIESTIVPTEKACRVLLGVAGNVANHPLLRHLDPNFEAEPEKAMGGILESYPFYTALAFRVNGPLQHDYHQLQAQIFLASHIIESHQPGDCGRLLTSFRGVRYLSLAKYQNQLATIPKQTVKPEEFLQKTDGYAKNSRLAAARVIIEKSLIGFQQQPPVEAVQKKFVPSPIKTEKPLSESDWVGTERITGTSLGQNESQQYRNMGGSPAELSHPTDFIPVVATENRTCDRSTLRELAFQATQTSHKIAIRNQLSPFSWQELNQFDLSVLMQFLHGETVATTSYNPRVKLLLTLMFWGSCPLTRALELKISLASHPRLQAPECLYWDHGKNPYLRFYSPGPELSEESNDRRYQQARPVSHHVNIPLPDIACTLIGQAIDMPKDDMTEENIFPQSPTAEAEITGNLKQTLRELNRQFGTRLSPGRISNHLLRHLARWPGEDLSRAMMFFGRADKSAVTRIHYTVAPLPQIEQAYKKMVSSQTNEIGYQVTFSSESVNPSASAVGTPWCPTPETIQNLVWQLQQNLEDSRPAAADIDLLANFHTHYTLYTATLVAFATGYRAINNPSFRQEEIDTQTGLAIISDKDDDFHYSTRMVWLAPVCLEQIDNYHHHLMAIWDRLGPNSEPFFQLLKQAESAAIPLDFFFVDHTLGRAEPFRPGHTEKLLRATCDYELPPNANRHYLKNQLLDSGCSPEIIEAFLGHWELGQEPWNSLSNLSPLTFKDLLKPHLEPLLKRDGWRAIKGYRDD